MEVKKKKSELRSLGILKTKLILSHRQENKMLI